MLATELAKAIHDLILERGDVDIAVLDPFAEPGSGTSDWTGDLALISQPLDDGSKIIGMIIPRPADLRMPEDLASVTMVHSGPRTN